MPKFLKVILRSVALAISLWCLPLVAPSIAQTTASITYFDSALAPYGYWVDDPHYGRVWVPAKTGPEWRPYAYGRWVWTKEYGWVWVSEEPWGWATYHYGYWVWTDRHGWVWVAGDTWGPAWVEWCYGGGYAGWTPMAPDPYWQSGYYVSRYDCDAPRYRSRWVFVAETHFAAPRISAHVLPASQNAAIASKTANVTSYAKVGGSIFNRSIDVQRVGAATAKTITPVRVVPAGSKDVKVGVGKELRELPLYRPKIPTSATSANDRMPTQLILEPDKKDLKLPTETSGRMLEPEPVLRGTPSTTGLPEVRPDPLSGRGTLGGVGGGLGGLPGRLGR